MAEYKSKPYFCKNIQYFRPYGQFFGLMVIFWPYNFQFFRPSGFSLTYCYTIIQCKIELYVVILCKYIVGCRGSSQLGGSLLGIPPRV